MKKRALTRLCLSACALALSVACVCGATNASPVNAPPERAVGISAPLSVARGAGHQADLAGADALWEHIRKGGRIVVVLIAMSIAMLTFAIERAFNLRCRRIVPDGLAQRVDELWKEGKYDEIRELCARNRSILAHMIVSIVDHRDNDVMQVQTFAHDLGSRELRLELRRAYPLAVIATLSPLLGLLGTVVGMVGAFETVALAGTMGDAGLLADDISKALITTQDGLLVAIPALALYHYFRSKTNYFAVLLEEQASELVSRWLMKRAPCGEPKLTNGKRGTDGHPPR